MLYGSVYPTDAGDTVTIFHAHFQRNACTRDTRFGKGLHGRADLSGIFCFQGFHPIDNTVDPDVVIRLHETTGAAEVYGNRHFVSRGDGLIGRLQAEFAVDIVETKFAVDPPNVIRGALQGREIAGQRQTGRSNDRFVINRAGTDGRTTAFPVGHIGCGAGEICVEQFFHAESGNWNIDRC